jgi:hypothetical protein
MWWHVTLMTCTGFVTNEVHLCFQRDRTFWEHEGRQACLFRMLPRQECDDGSARRLYWHGTVGLVGWHAQGSQQFWCGVRQVQTRRTQSLVKCRIVWTQTLREVKLLEEKLHVVGVLKLSMCVPFPAYGSFNRTREIRNLNPFGLCIPQTCRTCSFLDFTSNLFLIRHLVYSCNICSHASQLYEPFTTTVAFVLEIYVLSTYVCFSGACQMSLDEGTRKVNASYLCLILVEQVGQSVR